MYYHPRADKNGMLGKGICFERIRRITGYLVGTLDRFNKGKRAEERNELSINTCDLHLILKN